MAAVTVSSKGQIVIPKEIRQRAGLAAGDRLEVRMEGDTIVLKRSPRTDDGETSDWRRWRGVLRGTGALADLEREHREEVDRDARLP